MEDLKKTISEKKLFSLEMVNVIKLIESHNIKLNSLNGIEIFGGTGTTDILLGKKLKSFEIWEIDENCESKLKDMFPNSKIKICDSIKILKENNNLSTYDLILLDNPMSVFGSNNEPYKYCEHFDTLENISKLIDKSAIVIFLVNKKPFYHKKLLRKNTLWKERRKSFYGNLNINNLSNNFLINFYIEFFKKYHLKTLFANNIIRHNPHLDYYIFKLEKINSSNKIKNIDWVSLSGLIKTNS
tara:strand:- start:2292 stop:3017 length:726 start_codon:yes stop_codon:yes gene_type:complete